MFMKKLPLDPSLSQLNLVHTPTTCFMIHFNIILPSIHTSSKRSFLSGILNFCALCSLSVLCVSNCENHYADFFVLLFIVSCSNIIFSILSSNNEHMFFPENNRPVSYQYTTMEKITVWCFLMLNFSYRRQKILNLMATSIPLI